MTSCPRKEPYIHRSLKSLSEAGFDFVSVVHDGAMSGSSKNFNRALSSALSSRDVFGSDWIVVFQDDILVSKNLRQVLERDILHPCSPSVRPCVVSLYCSEKNDTGFNGTRLHCLEDPFKVGGACAICMTTAAAEKYLKNTASRRSNSQTDYNLAMFCRDQQVPYFVTEPSLVQHIGATSSFVNEEGVPILLNSLNEWRRAGRFCEDASQWCKSL